MSDLISKARVVDVLAKIYKDHPTATNPFIGVAETCVYTSLDDPDRHCLAGQVMVELGVDPPKADEDDNTDAFVSIEQARRFTPAAKRLINDLQYAADRQSKPWRDSIALNRDTFTKKQWATITGGRSGMSGTYAEKMTLAASLLEQMVLTIRNHPEGDFTDGILAGLATAVSIVTEGNMTISMSIDTARQLANEH